MAVGAFPGSFNPVTIAHLAVAQAARDQCGLERVDLVLSRDTLGKAAQDLVRLEDRHAVLDAVAAARPWIGVHVTDARFIADIAEGYDVIVLGADKWAQVVDPAWYDGSIAARDAAVARLPQVACAPRPPHDLPGDAIVLEVHPDHHAVSASDVRGGRREWMSTEAIAFDDLSGAWSDAERYRRWVAAN
jgi:Cytidylyltransferase-like